MQGNCYEENTQFIDLFFCKILQQMFYFFEFFKLFSKKMLKMTNLTSVWRAQHPNAGRKIQHSVYSSISLVTFLNFFLWLILIFWHLSLFIFLQSYLLLMHLTIYSYFHLDYSMTNKLLFWASKKLYSFGPSFYLFC